MSEVTGKSTREGRSRRSRLVRKVAPALLFSAVLSGCQASSSFHRPVDVRDHHGRVTAMWIKVGLDGEGCQLFRQNPLASGPGGDSDAIWYWNGEDYSRSSESCTNYRGVRIQ